MTVFSDSYSKELKNPTFNNSDFVSGVLLFDVDQASNGWTTASVNIDQDMPFQPMFEVRFPWYWMLPADLFHSLLDSEHLYLACVPC